MGRFRCLLLAAACALLSAGSEANAGTLFDNLAYPSSFTDDVGQNGPFYDSFSTGGGTALLSDVKLLLSGNPASSASFTVSLLSDSSTSPGTVLESFGTFSESSLSSTAADVDFALSTPYALAANTRYWIELSGPSSTVSWNYATGDSGVGVAGEYWAYTPSGTVTVAANGPAPNAPYVMQVNTVPEPGSLVPGAIGLMVLAIARRRGI